MTRVENYWSGRLSFGGLINMEGYMDVVIEFSEHPCIYIISFILVSALGVFIGPLLNKSTENLDKPEKFLSKKTSPLRDWHKLFFVPDGGWIIGLIERNLFLFAILVGHPELILGWLAFKLGAQFQAWGNIIKVPDHLKNVDDIEFMFAKKMWGDRTYQRFVIGTALNIVAVVFVYLFLAYLLVK